MFQNIKLLSSDIDGTLVDSSHHIKPTTINTIKELKEKGYIFGLASGRPLRDVKHITGLWNILEYCDFIIAWNGCELWDKQSDQVYRYNPITKDELKEIVGFITKYEGVINMYGDETFISSSDTQRAQYSAYKINREFVVANSLEDFYKKDNYGIMFRTKLETMPTLEKQAEEFCEGKNYQSFKTQEDLLEFSDRDSNKGFALKKLSEIRGITLDEIMAFGDTTNDNEMLACCHGVCLVNGSSDTKACAKYITDKSVDEFGFTDFIDKHLLKKEE